MIGMLCLAGLSGLSGCHLGNNGGISNGPLKEGPKLETCGAILDAFIAQGRFKINLDTNDHGDHRVMCLADENGTLSITIVNSTPGQKREKLAPFEYRSGNAHAVLDVYREFGDILVASSGVDPTPAVPQFRELSAAAPAAAAAPKLIAIGTPAKGAGMSASGTLGWNIVLNNVPVCVSNLHVLSAGVMQPRIGSAINLNSPATAANLYTFNRLKAEVGNTMSPVNYWDVAVGQYAAGYAPSAAPSSCNPLGYPTRLSPPGVAANQVFHILGSASPCKAGIVMNGFNYGAVILNGTKVYFDHMMAFKTTMTDRDSGAIYVRDPDNTVAGIHMAKGSSGGVPLSFASPLYRVPWTYNGLVPAAGGMLPSYTFSNAASNVFGNPTTPW